MPRSQSGKKDVAPPDQWEGVVALPPKIETVHLPTPKAEQNPSDRDPRLQSEALPQWQSVVRQRRRLRKHGLAMLDAPPDAEEEPQQLNSTEEMPRRPAEELPRVSTREEHRLTSPVLVLTSRHQLPAEVKKWLDQHACGGWIGRTLDAAAELFHNARWGCLIVDVDSFKDLQDAVDTLVTLRQQRPNLPVILISAQVKRHDFSVERLPMCDVTLRIPVALEDLDFALQEAMINNHVWVMRCRKMKLLAAT